MKIFIVAAILGLGTIPAQAQLSGCQNTNGPLVLSKVRSTASGTQIIGCINDSFDKISSTVSFNSTTSVHTADWLNVRRISGISTGTAGIRISSFMYITDNAYATFGGSVAVNGAAGLGVTYNVSAGSATFGATTRSTFTSTGLWQASVNGIQWSDGTVSTSAVSAGGAAVLIATQTFSGANTFTSTVTFNNVEVATISFSLKGKLLGVASGNFSVAVSSLVYIVGPGAWEVCTHGSIFEAGSGPCVAWNFTIDNAFIGTMGLNAAFMYADLNNGDTYNVSACYPIKAGTISQGARTIGFRFSGCGNPITGGGSGNLIHVTSADLFTSVRPIR